MPVLRRRFGDANGECECGISGKVGIVGEYLWSRFWSRFGESRRAWGFDAARGDGFNIVDRDEERWMQTHKGQTLTLRVYAADR